MLPPEQGFVKHLGKHLLCVTKLRVDCSHNALGNECDAQEQTERQTQAQAISKAMMASMMTRFRRNELAGSLNTISYSILRLWDPMDGISNEKSPRQTSI